MFVEATATDNPAMPPVEIRDLFASSMEMGTIRWLLEDHKKIGPRSGTHGRNELRKFIRDEPTLPPTAYSVLEPALVQIKTYQLLNEIIDHQYERIASTDLLDAETCHESLVTLNMVEISLMHPNLETPLTFIKEHQTSLQKASEMIVRTARRRFAFTLRDCRQRLLETEARLRMAYYEKNAAWREDAGLDPITAASLHCEVDHEVLQQVRAAVNDLGPQAKSDAIRLRVRRRKEDVSKALGHLRLLGIYKGAR